MSTYHVTGVSGSGKSTVAAELRQRGVAAVDTDAEPGLARFVDGEGRVVDRPDAPDNDWLASHRWVWDEDRLLVLIEAHRDRPLFLCGHANNEADFNEHYAAVFLLQVDEETMLARLADPSRDNDFGAVGDTGAMVRWWRPLYQDRLLARGAVPIDAGRPAAEVAELVLARSRAGSGSA